MNEKNKDINEKINNLNKEINDLKEKLKRYPFVLEKGEQLISIIISSRDEKILYSLSCKSNKRNFAKHFLNILKMKIFFHIKEK